jgi:hypothetical protein
MNALNADFEDYAAATHSFIILGKITPMLNFRFKVYRAFESAWRSNRF